MRARTHRRPEMIIIQENNDILESFNGTLRTCYCIVHIPFYFVGGGTGETEIQWICDSPIYAYEMKILWRLKRHLFSFVAHKATNMLTYRHPSLIIIMAACIFKCNVQLSHRTFLFKFASLRMPYVYSNHLAKSIRSIRCSNTQVSCIDAFEMGES